MNAADDRSFSNGEGGGFVRVITLYVIVVVMLIGVILSYIKVRAGEGNSPISNAGSLTLYAPGYSVLSAQGVMTSQHYTSTRSTRYRRPAPAQNCTFSISPDQEMVSAKGTQRSISVTASYEMCKWTVIENLDWLTVTSGTEGMGNGAVLYSVAPHRSSFTRVGGITVAGQTFIVIQSGSQERQTLEQ